MTRLQEQISKRFRHFSMKQTILPKIKGLIALTFESVKNKLNINNRRHCFELFGYDFIIDSEFNVWLIEVNTNPCIEESSPLLQMLIPRMLGTEPTAQSPNVPSPQIARLLIFFNPATLPPPPCSRLPLSSTHHLLLHTDFILQGNWSWGNPLFLLYLEEGI